MTTDVCEIANALLEYLTIYRAMILFFTCVNEFSFIILFDLIT